MDPPTKDLSSFQEPTHQLLDPGPSPRPKRKLGCKSILWMFLVLLVLGFAWTVFLFLRGGTSVLQNPHSKLYQDLTRFYRPQDVVRPLIDSNQTFDIVATVWLKTEILLGPSDLGYSVDQPEGGNITKRKTRGIQERALFSKTVFTGLTLGDKQLTTSVNFQVPTSIFKLKILNNYDLRGSFVLVPTSTSLLDHVQNFTSWIPREAGYPPVRSWTETSGLTLKDEVIDSYGTFTPLLTFYDIKSRCPPSDDSLLNVDDADDGDDVEQNEHTIILSDIQKARQKWTSTKGKYVLSAHPYIITRSLIGVADMTKVFNKEAYNKAHKSLRTLSCGRLGKAIGGLGDARWQDCLRSYVKNGNQEVSIKIARPTGENDKLQTQWLYAPYIMATQNGWGPQDLIPVPVNREECRPDPQFNSNITAVPDEEYVNVTWNIAFSGMNPAQLQFLENRDLQARKHNMTDTSHKHLSQQHLQELLDGLYGHRHRQTYHPRWEALLTLLVTMLFCASTVFDFLYWYTRSSTVGISLSGTTILSVAMLLELVVHQTYLTIRDDKSVWQLSFAWSLVTESSCRAILMLKTISRADLLCWPKTWLPAIHFAPATHAERRSQRLDSQITWWTKVTIYASLMAFFTVIYNLGYYIVLPRGTMMEFKNQLIVYLDAFPKCAIVPALVLGRLLQIVLNFRSKTFAGMYRVTTYVRTLEFLFMFLSRSPWIVGEALVSAPVTYFDLFELVGYIALVYQSQRYPVVSDLDEEDNIR